MRKRVLAAAATMALVLGVLSAIPAALRAVSPSYPPSLAAEHAAEKVTNTFLVSEAARQENSLLIFGSSELKTTDILTHPVNFFAGSALQIDPVGRGSCQSLVHALNTGGQGENLRGKRIVLITAPQSYVEGGIAPDLFLANYSERQLLNILRDEAVPDELKTYLARRVQELFAEYEAGTGSNPEAHTAGDVLSKAWANGSPRWPYLPYAALSNYLDEAKEVAAARPLLTGGSGAPPAGGLDFDWTSEEEKALAQAARMVTNNDFYMQDGYYSTYVGAKLDRLEGKDSALSYDSSPEYGDLRALLDLCALRDIKVLFVHVPMNGKWNDYTGFTAERRERYYENVREIAKNYPNITLLDLTEFEYEPYFLCDTMHLGWKGWLAVDRAIVDFTQQG